MLNVNCSFRTEPFFVAFRNPNQGAKTNSEWREYTQEEHNYIFFQLNNIHTEYSYFDSMYDFWLKCFQTELNGRCENVYFIMKMKKHFGIFFLILLALLLIMFCYFLRKYYRKKQHYRAANDLIQYPNFLNT